MLVYKVNCNIKIIIFSGDTLDTYLRATVSICLLIIVTITALFVCYQTSRNTVRRVFRLPPIVDEITAVDDLLEKQCAQEKTSKGREKTHKLPLGVKGHSIQTKPWNCAKLRLGISRLSCPKLPPRTVRWRRTRGRSKHRTSNWAVGRVWATHSDRKPIRPSVVTRQALVTTTRRGRWARQLLRLMFNELRILPCSPRKEAKDAVNAGVPMQSNDLCSWSVVSIDKIRTKFVLPSLLNKCAWTYEEIDSETAQSF